jgi:hypothetical protein
VAGYTHNYKQFIAHIVDTSRKYRSAEDGVLCRGAGCPRSIFPLRAAEGGEKKRHLRTFEKSCKGCTSKLDNSKYVYIEYIITALQSKTQKE